MESRKLGFKKRGAMKERRKQERKNLVAYTQVYDLYSGNLLGYLGDLTFLGAMIITEKPIPPNTEFTLSFELPEIPDTRAVRISIESRSAWCEKDLSPQFYNVGFEFKEVSVKQKAIIEAIIEHYQFRRDVPDYPPRPNQKR